MKMNMANCLDSIQEHNMIYEYEQIREIYYTITLKSGLRILQCCMFDDSTQWLLVDGEEILDCDDAEEILFYAGDLEQE